MEQLSQIKGADIIRSMIEADKPLFGICVGMQILFSEGVEKGTHEGVGIFPGTISRINAPILPHMGWNTVSVPNGSQLFDGVTDESFYFVHSYAAKGAIEGAKVTTASYGEDFVAAVERGKVSATQFHPEKSGKAGALLIKNWAQRL